MWVRPHIIDISFWSCFWFRISNYGTSVQRPPITSILESSFISELEYQRFLFDRTYFTDFWFCFWFIFKIQNIFIKNHYHFILENVSISGLEYQHFLLNWTHFFGFWLCFWFWCCCWLISNFRISFQIPHITSFFWYNGFV